MTDVFYDTAEHENPINVDESIDDDKNDVELKEKLARVIAVFFMRQRYGDMNFVDNIGKATPAFTKCIACIEYIRDIGEVFHTIGLDVAPSVLRRCGIN